jgi:hypothetical protein
VDAVPRDCKCVYASRRRAPELAVKDRQERVVLARKTVHGEGSEIFENVLKYGRLKSKVIDLVHFRKVVSYLVLLPRNPLRQDFDGIIVANQKRRRQIFCKCSTPEPPLYRIKKTLRALLLATTE